MFRTFVAIAALALTVTAAEAGSPTVVHYGDLDLSSSYDALVLKARIHQAAAAACDSLTSADHSSAFYDFWLARCVRETSAETTARIVAKSNQTSKVASK